MTKRMLIDTTHAEETRVVVLDGSKLDDYDVETSSKKQLKGNIYLAKIVRIEPSLQAAFVEYGGNRHGFLAFSEIHPDYYQIPVADRERLLALQEEEARAEEARADREELGEPDGERSDEGRDRPRRSGRRERGDRPVVRDIGADVVIGVDDGPDGARDGSPDAGIDIGADTHPDVAADPHALDRLGDPAEASRDGQDDERPGDADDGPVRDMPLEIETDSVVADADGAPLDEDDDADDEAERPAPETVGGETPDDGQAQRRTARFLRQYKIQEVMRRRQILLVQVVKEERGNKGAALTTYISLAGRFCVLMPNSPRGGGVSRKITSAADRRRLKEITQELEIPRGMGMIVRTAGAQRPRPEIRRDCEYLLRTWDEIRDTTLASIAPCLVYEEASLIKRAIRDVYTRDVEEIVVDGEAGWKSAREFMRTLMPANAGRVNLWRDAAQTLFSHHGVEHQLDAMLQPTVQLRSGGYLVINQTEALVAIDVNSGRSTRERGIEETAFRTNMEAADEVARQLRLRDLAGLIVIDFIDMEVRRNNAAVERRLKDALRHDRARIQVGSISHFGLLEMSRQRLRPSIAESAFVPCAQCGGTGFTRGTESSALHVLRAIEEEAIKRKASEILVHAAGSVAFYVLNHKRAWLGEIEARHGLAVHLAADDTLLPPNLRIDRIRPWLPPVTAAQPAAALHPGSGQGPVPGQVPGPVSVSVPIGAAPSPAGRGDAGIATEIDADEEEDEVGTVAVGGDRAPERAGADGSPRGEEDGGRRRKRRRRRRGGRREDGQASGEAGAQPNGDDPGEADDDETETDGASGTERPVAEAASDADETGPAAEAASTGAARDGVAGRNRRRRGGRRRGGQESGAPFEADRGRDDPDGAAAEIDTARPAPRAYAGPTPADPFAGSFDIFEMIERDAEEMSAVMPSTAASAASFEPAPHSGPAGSGATGTEATGTEAIGTEATEPAVTGTDATGPQHGGPDAGATAADPAEASAEPAEASAAIEPVPAPAGDAGPKPRKPRASRARKPAAAAETEPAEAASDAVATVVAEPADPSARPRRKPAPRGRAKAAVAVETAAADADAAQAVPAPVEFAAPVEVAAPDQPAAVAEPASATPAPLPDDSAPPAGADPSIVRPKVIDGSAPPAARRTGWWKR